MKTKSAKFFKKVSISIITSFVISTLMYINANAVGVGVNNGYVWSEDKQYKSERYLKLLEEHRNKVLSKLLDVDNVDKYLSDMKSFYELSYSSNKVDEVEEIMSNYEKNRVYIELLLLTGDKELAEKFRNDKELYFKFERVM